MAKKQRFRKTKQGIVEENFSQKIKKPKIPFASTLFRAKAFLTDTFMLFMPIMYFVIYIVMGSLEEASHQKLLSWSYALIPYLLLLTIFMYKDEGRTPGTRSQSLKIIDVNTLEKPVLFSIIFRNITFILTLLIPFAWFVPFFRKDSRTLHDFLSNTSLIRDIGHSKC
jgi:uncharacterized RDD family membrane protein YckC